jgi:hypothetical protein
MLNASLVQNYKKMEDSTPKPINTTLVDPANGTQRFFIFSHHLSSPGIVKKRKNNIQKSVKTPSDTPSSKMEPETPKSNSTFVTPLKSETPQVSSSDPASGAIDTLKKRRKKEASKKDDISSNFISPSDSIPFIF